MIPKHVSTLLTTGNEITRIFHITELDNSSDDILVVRHAPITDNIEVTLNGLLMHTIEESGGRYWFGQRKKKYVITIRSNSNWLLSKTGFGNYIYTLEVDGKNILENTERLLTSPSSSSSTIHTKSITVNEYVIQGDDVVWYLIKWPENNVHVHRRYRDFYLLYSQICSAYRLTHLYDSVPEVPPREISLTSNKNPQFLTTRMHQLEVFLKKLSAFPGISLNPDLQEFYGIGSSKNGVYETSVIFHEEGKLGIKLKQPGPVSENTTGSTFSAQISDLMFEEGTTQVSKFDPNRIQIGDMITRVGGESALLIGYDKVIELMQKKELRPVVVHLLGVRDYFQQQ